MLPKAIVCAVCGETIDPSQAEYITKYSNSYYHGDCFIKKKTSARQKKWTEQQCIDYINENLETCLQTMRKLAITDEFYCWLMDFYGIQVIPSYFFTKMADVFAGRYKGISMPIPVEDVFDMWKRKSGYLTKVYVNNQSNGKTMSPDQRLSYDLAILLNKYDSYLAWKEETRLSQIEAEQRTKEMAETKYSMPVKPQLKTGGINIYNILDEI